MASPSGAAGATDPKDPTPGSPAAPWPGAGVNPTSPAAAKTFATLVKLNFQAKGIQIPTQWSGSPAPVILPGDPRFGPGNLGALATNLFRCPTTYKIHVDTCIAQGDALSALIDDLAKGLMGAWGKWQSSVKFAKIMINGPAGVLSPGSLVAAPLLSDALIVAQCAPFGRAPSGRVLCEAVAKAIGPGLERWAKLYSLPNLAFPGGALCSASMVPSPNTPALLSLGTSGGDLLLSTPNIKAGILNGLKPPGNHGEALADAIAKAFNMTFTMWKSTTLIMNVMGAGGVAPAPPAPAGPVAGAIGTGGGLSSLTP